ncbi:MAG: DEAD/DEAH box helicase [Deltaproteobacteria bacterium]|nr:DEAD/DEAH box helicase [Deltaproteobacteria bacterium]
MMRQNKTEITLKDRLSHLKYMQACRLLGQGGEELIKKGGKYEINIEEQVRQDAESFTVKMSDAVTTIRLNPLKNNALDFGCSVCQGPCEHLGATLSLILEEKTALGLAKEPTPKIPIESLSEQDLVARAIQERIERAKKERMVLTSTDKNKIWTDYLLSSKTSGKTYRVAMRGFERGQSYCSCSDFKKNTLGVCKHILYAQQKIKTKFSPRAQNTPYKRKGFGVHMHYGQLSPELRLLTPDTTSEEIAAIIRPVYKKPVTDIHSLLSIIKKLEGRGFAVNIYSDAEEYIQQQLSLEKLKKISQEIRKDPKDHPLRKTLLKTELLPYQMDGIGFAVGAGRSVLADDMGLGKTIQGIGVAELLAKQTGISKALVVCPTSLKFQWREEINRFSDRSVQTILGSKKERGGQYNNGCFFTVCNYEQVLRDIIEIESVAWDLIILDEGQRIKNWEAKTSQTIKSLRSKYALVLTGTPLENRLEELYSVVEFISEHQLGPAFRFYNRYKVVDEKGKPLGYKNLDEIREKLKPVLLRRTRKSVMEDLPPRTTQIVRITPTDEQLGLDKEYKKIISRIINKPYISEMDLLRLQKYLLMCRMSADSTFLVNKVAPGYSSKLVELEELLKTLLSEEDRKIVLFSEWTTMLDLIEPLIKQTGAEFVRLDGSVPQKKRQGLVKQFQNNPGCKVFITTNAGSTGLNLQAANTVINVDLPWNPAVLEQRISRAHRMGQKRAIQVYLLVTVDTIEESLLHTLAVKQELAFAALDVDSNITQVDMSVGIEELKRRLEVLVGQKPDAPVDMSQEQKVVTEAALIKKRETVAMAGGELLSAAFSFMGEVLTPREKGGDIAGDEQNKKVIEQFKRNLSDCLDRDESGNLKLTVTLPNEGVLEQLAASLAKIYQMGTAEMAA